MKQGHKYIKWNLSSTTDRNCPHTVETGREAGLKFDAFFLFVQMI